MIPFSKFKIISTTVENYYSKGAPFECYGTDSASIPEILQRTEGQKRKVLEETLELEEGGTTYRHFRRPGNALYSACEDME